MIFSNEMQNLIVTQDSFGFVGIAVETTKIAQLKRGDIDIFSVRKKRVEHNELYKRGDSVVASRAKTGYSSGNFSNTIVNWCGRGGSF